MNPSTSSKVCSHILIYIIVLLCEVPLATAAGRRYKDGDIVDLYANKVGPFANPSETYQYYTMPLCGPKQNSKEKLLGLGEVLEGTRLVTGPYQLHFKQNIEQGTLCTRFMSDTDLEELRNAILQDFYFQLLMDNDIPVWGFLGKLSLALNATTKEEENQLDRIMLFTHLHFDIQYNSDQLIQVDVSTDPKSAIDITDMKPQNIEFTYSASWESTDTPYSRRLDRYLKYSFLPQHVEVHWFSILNSCATVIVLTGVLGIIMLRVLRADVARFSDPESGDADAGWKMLHGDVFRPPKGLELFTACIGVGAQILVVVAAVFALALAGHYHPYNRGALLASCVFLYALTAGIAGYVSGKLYKQLGGIEWAANILIEMILFCGPLLLFFSVLNSIAWFKGSTAALPFGTIVIIFLLWTAVTVPLTIGGAVVARRGHADLGVPCRISKHPREIPDLPWYRTAVPQMIFAGFLPFSAIYIELQYVFASVWGHKIYTIYSVLFIVYCVLLLVTAAITVAFTYFQLAAEDHRWWWRSFVCGGSTGLFVYGYATWFFCVKSNMNGIMQTAFFFGYNFIVCYAVFLMLGTVGWWAAFVFVSRIYRAVKAD